MQFNSMYKRYDNIPSLDYSRVEEKIFSSIPPYAVDSKTGQILNKNTYPILKQTGVINLNEKIQSYAGECDLYKILERFALTEDPSIINQRVGMFGDFTNLPDNINDFNKVMDKYFAEIRKFDKDIASKIFDENVPTSEILKLIDSRIANALQKNDNNESGV